MCGPCFYAQPAQREKRRKWATTYNAAQYRATTHEPVVYFVACGDLDLVKIGTTVSLRIWDDLLGLSNQEIVI